MYLRATDRIVCAPFNAHSERERLQYAGRVKYLI